MPGPSPELRLREEFNRWAASGRGEEMAEHHLPIVLPVLELMALSPRERLLDVGCGAGWLCRMLGERFPAGQFIGVDVSDEMEERARRASHNLQNLSFQPGAAERLPWPDASFTKVVWVESAYYWLDPARGLGEIFRVLAPGGSAWILINYYRDNPYCHPWGALLSVPTHLLSATEWARLFRDAGFAGVAHRRILDNRRLPRSTPAAGSKMLSK